MSTKPVSTDPEEMSEEEKDDLLARLADDVEDEDPVLSQAFALASQVDSSEGSN